MLVTKAPALVCNTFPMATKRPDSFLTLCAPLDLPRQLPLKSTQLVLCFSSESRVGNRITVAQSRKVKQANVNANRFLHGLRFRGEALLFQENLGVPS
jgi:hypothetical protein